MMQPLTIRPRSRDDDPRLVEIFNSFEDVFVLNLDSLRYYLDERVRPGNIRPEVTVAARDGEVVGLSWTEAGWWTETPGVFFGEVGVDRRLWDQGIGSALWEDLEGKILERGITKIYTRTIEGVAAAERFARDRGFERTGRTGRASRLTVDEVNLDGYDELDARLAAGGITIVPMSQLNMDDETLMRGLHQALQEAAADIPSSEEFHGQPYDVWRQNFLKSPDTSADTYWVALQHGNPVGAANLNRRDETHFFNGFTGVAREARGKGLARALKLETIKWAKANGVKYIDTENDIDNKRMLDINIRLGYRPLPAREEWVREFST